MIPRFLTPLVSPEAHRSTIPSDINNPGKWRARQCVDRSYRNPMALAGTTCWTLLLGACLAAAARAHCGKDCVHCAFHLAGRHADMDALTCILGCEGKLQAEKSWDLCKGLLQGKVAESSIVREAQETTGGASREAGAHMLEKKYGGFMKRYGGFMKKTAELYSIEHDDDDDNEEAEEEVDHGREILGKRYGGFMKKDSEGNLDGVAILKEVLRTGGDEGGHGIHEDEVSKRYGGFMRSVKRSSDLEDGIKELQKRYGGFMRRVGRPEWKEDQKKYGGFLKRSREEDPEGISEDIPYMDKRYGGFMMY
ncbi:proenkephalin-A [Arapaima gigas]